MNEKEFNRYALHKQGYSNHYLMPYDEREPWERMRDAHESMRATFDRVMQERKLKGNVENKLLELLKPELEAINVKINIK